MHIIYTYLVNHRWIWEITGIETLMPFLAAGFIGLAASRNHFKKKDSNDKFESKIKIHFD